MKRIIEVFLKNPVAANLIMVFILVSGFIASTSIVREIFPSIDFNYVTVTVSYPGADPAETEEAICRKIEEALEDTDGIKTMYSYAYEGSGRVTLELEDNYDTQKAKDEIETEINSISTFPASADRPIVKIVKRRSDVLDVVVWGDLPERQLKEITRSLETEIKKLNGITQAYIQGVRDYEISIEVSEEQLKRYGLNFSQIRDIIKANAVNVSAGNIRSNFGDFRIRGVGRKYEAKEYSKIPIINNNDGTYITLGQIAKVYDTFDIDSRFYSTFNGKPAATIVVQKTDTEDSIKISKIIHDFVEKKQAQLPKNINLTISDDNSVTVRGRLDLLIKNGKFGLTLVFISLWIFLNTRLSFWVTMGIPISIAGAIFVMNCVDQSLNMLSMFGLIMVLGLIVDDAIVVGEAIYTRREKGELPLQAAVNGTSEVFLSVIAAVFTTIIAYIPLYFIDGVIGRFIRQIPTPVIAALSFSLIESLFILPVHLRHIPDLTKKNRIEQFLFDNSKNMFYNALYQISQFKKSYARGLSWFIDHVYAPTLAFLLHWRYATLSASIAVLFIMVGMVQGRHIKFQFMPDTDGDSIKATVELESGAVLNKTALIAKIYRRAWEETIKEYNSKGKKIEKSYKAFIGGGNQNQFQIFLELTPSEERNVYYKDIIDTWKHYIGNVPGVVATTIKVRHGGKPGGEPIDVEISAEDYEVVKRAATALESKLKTIEGVYDSQIDWRTGKREFDLRIKPAAYKYGLTLSDIANYVRSGFYGSKACSIQRGRDDIDIMIRLPEGQGRNSIKYFKNLRIKTPTGERVPLKSVVEINLIDGPSVINRVDRQRAVSVTASINETIGSEDVIIASLRDNFLPKLAEEYQVNIKMRGQEEERRNSMLSIFKWFPIALLGIYFIIATIFKSYVQPVVVMITIPFGLIGGILGHIIRGIDISMMSIFAMIALAGIVVNDAIVFVEAYNSRLEKGESMYQALIYAGKRRFRAILLTTVTTFFGLIPMIYEKSRQAAFLIPMAITIAFGVLFATLLTLILIPCLILIINDIKRIFHMLWYWEKVDREVLEARSPKARRK
ncbi:efflux RND transporter permease subunit [Lentisphaerota bacterium WC36G]|nr:efflux RND transporter permease subunit [Lentisphaerae bacterium WC36]